MPSPVAYIRRSARSASDPGDLSREFQVDKVRALANGQGRDLVMLDGDWGKSASTDKTDQRLDFLKLIAMVESGDVLTVYAYATDRLARSVEWAARLLNACRRARVPIVTSEGRFEPDNAMTDQLFYFQAMQNEGFSRQASEKRRATVAIQKARGDVLGQKPYGAQPGEDPAAVVAAFREAGSYSGAVRLLVDRKVLSRRAHLGGSWEASTVKRIIQREAPELVPVTTTMGARTLGTHLFSRLVRCPLDGTVMTSMPRRDASPAYICRVGRRDRTHQRPFTIAESRIIPWAKEEAAKIMSLDVKWTAKEKRANEATLAQLAAKRGRWLEMYAEGHLTKAERDQRLGKIEADRATMESVRRVKSFTLRTGIDWTAPPATVNARLRELWRAIRLEYVPGTVVKGRHSMDLMLVPASVDWIVTPEELEARETAQEERFG